MKPSVLTKALYLTLSLSMITSHVPVVHAEQEEVQNESIQIIKGDIYTYDANNVARVSVTDPAIADISDAKKDKVLLLGKTAGQTILFVWDDDGKHAVNIVVVNEDLNLLKKRVDNLLEKAGISTVVTEVNAMEGKIVLSGTIGKDMRPTFDRLVESFGDNTWNLVKDENNQELIQIDMQITELSTTLSKNLGFDWGTATTNGPIPQIDYLENGVPGGGSKNWFKFGQFNRTAALVNSINLLIQEGKAKDLSRPRILVTSGKEATINVGGEIPTTSTTTNASGGSTQTNVTFKQYGVTLTVTPTIKEGKIDVVMNAQVSDVDKTFYTSSGGGTNDIAYKTRSAQTQLMLDDRQTVVFAGLIRYSESEQTKRLPFLGQIPLVGSLFRNKSNASPNEGKELVITLTPTIMRTKEYVTDQLKLPTKKMKELEKEVFKNGEFEKEKLPVVETKPTKVEAKPEATEKEITTNYVREVQTKIAKAISYPQEALENNLTGTVKLKLVIRRDGFLAGVGVEESSGQKIFDEDAINTAKSLVPYAKFPAGIKQDDLAITIPIVYSQTPAK